MISERIDEITRIAPTYRNTVLPAPKSVKIELTGKCNFACTFCARSDVLREQKHMDFDLYKKLVKDMREAGVEELGVFYLGESFMVSWLPEAIKYAKTLGFPYVFLTTNGSLAFPDRVEACMKAGLDSLKFSYNYANGQQLHDIARVKEKFFGTIQSNIKDAFKIRETGGYSCGLYASYIEYDGEQGYKMAKAVEEISKYVDEVYALPLYNQAASSRVVKRESDKGWKPIAGNRGRAAALREPLPCWAVFTEGHITSDGKLSACCFDHDGRFHMGDLTKVSFMEAWNSKEFQILRKAHLEKDVTGTACEKCVAYQ